LIAVDYIKLKILYPNIEYLLHLDCLDFKTEVSIKTKELKNVRIAIYHFCKIKIFDSGYVEFSGSIHKFWNSINGIEAPSKKNKFHKEGFNGNQFTFDNFINARNHLAKLFNTETNNLEIHNIEFGHNVTVNFNPLLFIKGLLYYKGELFNFRYKRNYAQVEFQQYILKIYNKGNQYGMSENVLRVEIKIRKMEVIKNTNIKTLADINKITLQKANTILLNRFNGISYYDYTIKKKELKKLHLEKVKNYSNPRYWIIDLNKDQRAEQKKILKEIIVNHSKNLQLKITNKLIQKTSPINRLSEKQKTTLINHSYIELISWEFGLKKGVRFCIVTGQNISMQKADSFLLAPKQILNLYHTNRKVFNEIKNKYLSKEWINASLEKQIFEIYHNIRNKASNIRIKQRKLYNKNQLQLF